MKLYELLDHLITNRTRFTNEELKTDLVSIRIGSNDAIIIQLGSEIIMQSAEEINSK